MYQGSFPRLLSHILMIKYVYNYLLLVITAPSVSYNLLDRSTSDYKLILNPIQKDLNRKIVE